MRRGKKEGRDFRGNGARYLVLEPGKAEARPRAMSAPPGDIALRAAETGAGAKTVCDGAGEHGPDGIAAPAHESKQHPQLKNLQSGMAAGRVHELREKREKEQSGF